MKHKNVAILSSIIVISIILIFAVVFLLIKENSENKSDLSKAVYGVVVERGNNYLLVEGIDENRYYVASSSDIETGTFVLVNYENSSDVSKENGSVEVVLDENETDIISDLNTTNPAYLDEDEKVTSRKITTTVSSRETTSVKTTYRYSDATEENEILSYVETVYSDIKKENSILENCKNSFITLVDFIFYGKEIKGKRFDELTSSVKAKIIYYALLIDNSIDSKWPDYKKNIQEKYGDIKAKLIAKYMELTTSICEASADNCAQAKRDFKLLKDSLKLTWNVIKNAFSYAIDKGKVSISEWYKTFSGKI